MRTSLAQFSAAFELVGDVVTMDKDGAAGCVGELGDASRSEDISLSLVVESSSASSCTVMAALPASCDSRKCGRNSAAVNM